MKENQSNDSDKRLLNFLVVPQAHRQVITVGTPLPRPPVEFPGGDVFREDFDLGQVFGKPRKCGEKHVHCWIPDADAGR